MSTLHDVVMIGAGIVGLATARELHSRHPELAIAVLDDEETPGHLHSGHPGRRWRGHVVPVRAQAVSRHGSRVDDVALFSTYTASTTGAASG